MSRYFPPASDADENGLLAAGGLLEPEWLLDAYSHGIFPWPFSDAEDWDLPTAWWSPDPRGIFDLSSVHCPNRLLRTIRGDRFEITCDADFSGVIRGCADRDEGTWITPEMIDAYTEMHRLGHAHCVEAKRNGQLVGGVYGIAIGGLFAAESMFYREPNASKVALIRLLHHLKVRGYQLVDVQMVTENTKRFGAIEISRNEYLHRLAAAVPLSVSFGKTLTPF